MKLILPAGTTSQIVHVFIQDATVTTGAGKTGLIHSDITAYYVRAGGTLTALTMETISTLGTWASTGDNKLGFKLLHDTNAPGLYELDLPNNILTAGANQVVIQLRATGAAPCCLEIQLAPVPADMTHVHGSALTEAGGAGRLAASISKFGDVAAPVFTAASVDQTGDAHADADAAHTDASAAASDASAAHAAIDTLIATVGAAGAGLTAIGDARLANLNATISSRSSHAAADVAALVLATPAQKLMTDASGRVTVGSNADKSGYSLATAPPTAAEIKTALEADGSKLDHLWETTEDDAGVRRFTANALDQAPGGGGGDATLANQTLMLEDLADIKGTGFVKDTNSMVNVTGAAPTNITIEATVVQD